MTKIRDAADGQKATLVGSEAFAISDATAAPGTPTKYVEASDLFSWLNSFETIATDDITINPIKPKNNYRFDRSGDGALTFNAASVVDGAEGIIKIVKDAGGTQRLLGFANPSLVKVSGTSLQEEPDYAASGKTITNAADNGGGLVRITATAHGYTTGDRVEITGIVGTVEANGRFTITVIDANNFDLDNSTFVNAYTSGGSSIIMRDYLALRSLADSEAIYSYFIEDGIMYITGTDDISEPV